MISDRNTLVFACKSNALLRQVLTKAGVEVPENVNLELSKYLNNRGTKPLNFQPQAGA